jgi:ribosomal protein L37AE/L43A
MGSCLDLRKYQDDEKVKDIYGKIVSGKKGYRSILERKREIPKCPGCGKNIEDEAAKFCSECGAKLK